MLESEYFSHKECLPIRRLSITATNSEYSDVWGKVVCTDGLLWMDALRSNFVSAIECFGMDMFQSHECGRTHKSTFQRVEMILFSIVNRPSL